MNAPRWSKVKLIGATVYIYFIRVRQKQIFLFWRTDFHILIKIVDQLIAGTWTGTQVKN